MKKEINERIDLFENNGEFGLAGMSSLAARSVFGGILGALLAPLAADGEESSARKRPAPGAAAVAGKAGIPPLPS